MAQMRRNVKRMVSATIASYQRGTIKIPRPQREAEVASLIADTERGLPIREIYEEY